MILLGLLLAAGGLGFLTYREVKEPHRWRATQAQRDMTPASRGFDTRSARPDSGAPNREYRRPERGQGRHLGGWSIFQMVVDVMNVLVGIIGISLAVFGVRLPWHSQRQ
jgi:hypothetical protein